MRIKIFTWITLFIIILSGCSIKDKLGLSSEDEIARPVSSVFVDETFAQKFNDKVPLHLYFTNNDGASLKMEIRYIPILEAKKSVQKLAGLVVKELITGPSQESGLYAAVPAGTKLLSEPTFKDGIVTINLSKDFTSKLAEDVNLEKLAVFSVVNSLTEIKEVERVKFTIEGKSKKDYKGALKIDAAFPRNPTLINSNIMSQVSDTIEVLD